MNSSKLYLLAISLLLLNSQTGASWLSFFESIWPKRTARLYDGDIHTLPKVPFEIGERDEKFIVEASEVLGNRLSDLDFCQQKIVLKLRSSCSSLDDEELSKLAVLLMNCQLHAEGQTGYECSDEMTLSQCTSSMDTEMKQNYHNFQNRAKTICLIIRQDQFRGLAEITVNNLVSSAHENIDLMAELKRIQKDLQLASMNTIGEVKDNSFKFLEQQHQLLKLAESQRLHTDQNLQATMRQRNLLKSGHTEISAMVSDLKTQIRNSLSSFQDQSEEANAVYKSLLADIETLHGATENIALRLDEASRLIVDQSKLTKDEFKETVTQLQEVNEIVSSLTGVIKDFHGEYKEKMKWVREQLGGSEEDVIRQLSTAIIHVAYLCVGMLCLIFLNAGMVNRVVFLIIVMLNLVAVLYNFVQLDVALLTETIAVVLGARYAIIFLRKFDVIKYFKIDKRKQNSDEASADVNHTDDHNLTNLTTRRNATSFSGHNISVKFDRNNNHHTDETTIEQFRRRTMPPGTQIQMNNEGDNVSDRSRSSTPFSSHSTSSSTRCRALTTRGTRCQLPAILTYCRIHDRPSYER